jgi:putative redox protein
VSRSVVVEGGRLRYAQNVLVGPHLLQGDEPVSAGGSDVGPNPYELLLAALGSCTSMTVRMYADRKQWPLEGVHIELSYARVHADDCTACDQELELVDGIEMKLSFFGELSESQRQRLTEIANRCPVHRTLESPIPIRARLAPARQRSEFVLVK